MNEQPLVSPKNNTTSYLNSHYNNNRSLSSKTPVGIN